MTDSNTKPSAATEPPARIEALDVVRGFALLGIFLMNIEYFNRATSGIMEGMPSGLTGVDWLASWFIAYFVQGKFWTIFSLLFGMGFAVMLTRAQDAQRPFLAVYLRRIGGLAVFGAAHYIFLWSGDILFSYAVGAGALLILLYGQWKQILFAVVLLVAIGFIPGLNPVFGIASSLATMGLLALYLRSDRQVTVRGRQVPVFSAVLLSVGALGAIAAVVFWALPNGPKEPRIPVTMLSISLLVLGTLSARFHNPPDLRALRLGATLYTFMFLMMTLGGAAQYFKPRATHAPASTGAATLAASSPAGAGSAAANPQTPAVSAAGPALAKDDGATEKKPEKTEAQKAAEKEAERIKRLENRAQKTRDEVRTLTQGSYADTVEMRARAFLEKAAGDAGFGMALVAMFLIGSWFVQSGIMADTRAHLPLFRKLAAIGLPLGIGLGLLGSQIAVSANPQDPNDAFLMARGLAMLGNLPACLGYVSVVVLMLHSPSFLSRIRVLAPVGRMALTNYLGQSVICSLVFFGYGLGQWGMARAWQVVFVAAVFALQVAFSHWWLARFRYGPMEWVWRAFTYRQTPLMRL